MSISWALVGPLLHAVRRVFDLTTHTGHASSSRDWQADDMLVTLLPGTDATEAGVPMDGAHTALGDAVATAGLLKHYLATAARMGVDPFSSLGPDPVTLTAAPASPAPLT